MSIWPTVRDVYGQLRGYNRLSIRREVARSVSMSADELATKTAKLRKARYLYALEHFPAYADLVRQHAGDLPSDLADIPFEKLPILSKLDLRSILSKTQVSVFIPQPSLILHSTGGSTGQPFKFNITRESYEWRTAVSDRGYSWAQAEEGQGSFYVWGTAIKSPTATQKLKADVHHRLQNRQYFDSFHFADAEKAECCTRIDAFKPLSLVGYAGNLIELARFVSRNPGALNWKARTGVTAAEGLRPGMRAFIEEHLVDDLFMSYGSREFMLIGMECSEHNGYHISSDNLYVEVVDDDGRPLPPGEVGRIVVTDLHNDATPFIRYAIGDLGSMAMPNSELGTPNSGVCRCGLPFPILRSVEGRLQEVIIKRDGEKLTALFIPHLMKEFEWVDGYQVVQGKPGIMTMNLVTQDAAWVQKTEAVSIELKKKLGDDMQIGFERVDQLEKNKSGKTPIMLKRKV
jgi:phenylacetate-CoA ligase